MKLLKRIDFTGDKDTAALFYWTGERVPTAEIKNGNIEMKKTWKWNSHCEMFRVRSVKTVLLNENSFVIRFYGNVRKRTESIKMHIKDPGQIEQLETLVEKTMGKGLNVLEHYANIDIKQMFNPKSE